MKKIGLLILIFCFSFLLVACGEKKENNNTSGTTSDIEPEEGRIVCTFNTTNVVGDSKTIVALQYNSNKTTITKITKEQSNTFNPDYIDFVSVTKDSYEISCSENKDMYDSCDVKVEDNKVILTTTINVKGKNIVMDEGITSNISIEDAISAYNNVGYICE